MKNQKIESNFKDMIKISSTLKQDQDLGIILNQMQATSSKEKYDVRLFDSISF